jgi:hypothetical protein
LRGSRNVVHGSRRRAGSGCDHARRWLARFAHLESDAGDLDRRRSDRVDRLRGQRPGQGRQPAVNAQDADKIYLITAQEIVRWTLAAGWTSIKGAGPWALPSSDLHSLAVGPQSTSTLYVGADIGVFVSPDDGANWYAFNDNLPNVLIDQIFWDGGYVYATTYGRGLWRRPGL